MPAHRLLSALAAAVVFATFPACVAQALHEPLPLHLPVQDKDFYLLSLFEKDPKVRTAIAADKDIAQVTAERQHGLILAQQACKGDAICTIKALNWTEEEIRAVSFALIRLTQENASVRALADKELRSSGAYVLYEKQPAPERLASAWEVCARGLNDVLSVYGQGLPPRYPLIDSNSVDLKSAEFQQQVSSLTTANSGKAATTGQFFEPSLKAALQLLTLNHRDEAGRLEPMETGVNQAAWKSISATRWQDYPYTVIVVPGAGPSDPNVALSEAGRKRCVLAAEAYHTRNAPFILLSGGYVHPFQTRFSEAIEMKKALVEDYHIPESAILVDPHARHTTTNMRNAAREIYRYNMPFNKAALVISDSSQIAYIAGQAFADRCLRELGYLPYRIVSQPSDTALVFLPAIQSLQQDPLDPLDP
jgi:uncharacterized SAM-binding protein YcdF (DUF218 family)